MSSSTKRKKLAKKALIISTAAKMFREKGFTGSSMRDLGEQIGIEAASLYNHIQSKSQILNEIIWGVARDCKSQLEELEASDGTALQKIEALIRFHTQMMLTRFEEYSVMVNEWIHLEQASLLEFTTERRKYVKKMETIVQTGIDNGEIKPLMPYVVVLNILSSVRGLEFWHKSAKTYTATEIEENVVAHLIGGLKN